MRCSSALFEKGNYFHFYNRAVAGEMLFREDADYISFLTKFKQAVKQIPAFVFAYCLMPNHFHFLL